MERLGDEEMVVGHSFWVHLSTLRVVRIVFAAISVSINQIPLGHRIRVRCCVEYELGGLSFLSASRTLTL